MMGSRVGEKMTAETRRSREVREEERESETVGEGGGRKKRHQAIVEDRSRQGPKCCC